MSANLCDVAIANEMASKIDSMNTKNLDKACNCLLDAEKKPAWELVWNDEFDKPGKVDPKKWKFETGGSGWGNDEDQFYTDRTENAKVENGKLIITGKKEDYENKKYTSARLNSAEGWTYGRYEFRAKMPGGKGTWPALWMLPDKQNYGEQYWPDNGEIDVLEAVGWEGNVNHASTHTKDYNFILQSQKTAVVDVSKADKEFHDYAVEWLPNKIEFFVDGKKYLTVEKEAGADWKKWPFDKDFHLVMNLAIGGFWGRAQGIDDSIFPKKFEIDYVRVYRPVSPELCKQK